MSTVTLIGLPWTRNVEVNDGNDHRDLLTIQSVDDAGTTADLDLTSATWTLVVSTDQGGTSILSKTTTTAWTASGVYVTSAADGEIAIVLIAADLATIAATTRTAWYEVVATFPATQAKLPSLVKTLLQGSLTINKDAVT